MRIKTTNQIVYDNTEIQLWKNKKIKTIVSNGFKRWVDFDELEKIMDWAYHHGLNNTNEKIYNNQKEKMLKKNEKSNKSKNDFK